MRAVQSGCSEQLDPQHSFLRLLGAACLLDSRSLVPLVQRLRLDAYRAEPLFLSLAAEYQRTKEVHMIMDSNP